MISTSHKIVIGLVLSFFLIGCSGARQVAIDKPLVDAQASDKGLSHDGKADDLGGAANADTTKSEPCLSSTEWYCEADTVGCKATCLVSSSVKLLIDCGAVNCDCYINSTKVKECSRIMNIGCSSCLTVLDCCAEKFF